MTHSKLAFYGSTLNALTSNKASARLFDNLLCTKETSLLLNINKTEPFTGSMMLHLSIFSVIQCSVRDEIGGLVVGPVDFRA